MNKLIINLTPTGMIPTREMTSYVPMTPEEIAYDVLVAARYGVSMFHLHARDADGVPTYEKEIYADIIERIRREREDLILCVSTSGRTFSEFWQRSQVLELEGDLKPDMASLTLSSLNFNRVASMNAPDMIQDLARKMLDSGIKPECEAFDLGMINYMKYLHKKELLEPPFYVNLILGNIACAQANLMSLGLMINELPEDSVWAVGGIGDWQLKMNVAAMVSGGGVRIGLEDNIFFDSFERKVLARNEDLVCRICDIAGALGLEVATPKEVRKVLCLQDPTVFLGGIK